MSADAVKTIVDHALSDPAFESLLLQNPQNAIGSQHGLNITPNDFTPAEMTSLGGLQKSDLDAIRGLRTKLNPMADVTGGVIL